MEQLSWVTLAVGTDLLFCSLGCVVRTHELKTALQLQWGLKPHWCFHNDLLGNLSHSQT